MQDKKLRLPNNDLIRVGSIRDMRANNGSVSVTSGGGMGDTKTHSFSSELSQKEVDRVWDSILGDIGGNILSWDDFADRLKN